jgi:phytol kinase
MHPVRDTLTAAGLLALFAVAEYMSRRGVSPERTRPAVHMVGAGVAATFPLYLDLADVVVLCGVFTVFLGGTWAGGRLRSVHAVRRPTAGALVFPLGLTVAALLTWPHPAAYAYAALVLALADPAASYAGHHVRSPTWRVGGGTKSMAGSMAFFAVTLTVGLLFTLPMQTLRLLSAVAVVVAMSEGLVGYGLDNLSIPIVAGLLGRYALGL